MDVNITSQGTPGADAGIDGIGSPLPKSGKTTSSSSDSVSSGGGNSGTQINPSPGTPVLSGSVPLSSAKMWELIMIALDQGHKQSITSDQQNDQYKLSTNLNVSTVATTYVVPDPQDSGKVTSITVNTSELNLQTKAEEILEANLGDVIFKGFKQTYAQSSPLSIDAAKAAITSYVDLAITAALWKGATTAESLLNLPGTVNNINLNPTAVGAAETVGFSQYIMGLVNSGDVQNFAQMLLPDDPKAASAFAALLSGALLEFALNQTSSGLGLPGLAEQVDFQAQTVRTENKLLANPLDVALISGQVAILSTEAGGSPIVDLESLVARGISAAMEKGPFLTRDDLQTELKTQFALLLPDNPLLANQLAENVESSTLAMALAGTALYSPTFDISKVNVQLVEDSIIQTMQRDFAASDEAIRLSAKQQQKIHDIVTDVLNKDLTSEQAVRDEIKEQLLSFFEDLSQEQASNAAAGISFGLAHGGPLYAGNTATSIAPSSFQLQLQTAYQDQVHISPTSDFGAAIDNVGGLTTEDATSSMIALINTSYYAAGNPIDKPAVNYLNLSGQDLIDFQNSKIGNSGAQIVMMFGEVLNGGTTYKNTQPPLAMTAG